MHKLASLSKSLFKLFSIYILGPILKRRRKGTKGERILFIEAAGLGDMCVLLPFVRGLTDHDYKVDVCCPEGVADFWKHFLPAQSQIITFNLSTLWSFRGVSKLSDDFGDTLYNAVFTVTQSSNAAFIAVCARSTMRLGMTHGKFYYKGSRILFDQLYHAKFEDHMNYRIEKQFELYHAIPTNFKEFVASSMPSPTGKFLLIHPGSKWIPKRWPLENYKTLALLLRRQGIPVTIAAHSSEQDIISTFSDFDRNDDQRFVITPDIKSLIDLTAQCSVYVGNDSGPSHLTNLFQKPMVIVWGPELVERMAPLTDNAIIIKKEVPCRPCRRKEGATKCANGENICLTRTSVDEVYNKVVPLWESI